MGVLVCFVIVFALFALAAIAVRRDYQVTGLVLCIAAALALSYGAR
jgi:hypothetical protein